jgi:hypothetical protein
MLWFNGKLLSSMWTGHCFGALADDTVIVHLKKGRNRIVMKTQKGHSSWGFSVSLSDTDRIYSTISVQGQMPEGLPDNPAFDISSETGQIKVIDKSLLNHEIFGKYILTIQVSDNGHMSHTGKILVTLGDVNEAPVFLPSETRYVRENSLANAHIGDAIAATENDEAQKLLYWTAGQKTRFFVDPKTGQLRVARGADLDFEKINVFDVSVFVKDNGIPPLSHSVPVKIIITDVNEYPDIVTKVVSVTENTSPAYKLMDVRSGECLTLESTRSGSVILLAHCESNLDKLQQWLLSSGGDIRAAHAQDLCLGVMDALPGKAELQECSSARRDLQKFKWDSGAGGKLCKMVSSAQCFSSSVELGPVEDAALWNFVFSPRPGQLVGAPIKAHDPDDGQTERLVFSVHDQMQFEGDLFEHFSIDSVSGQIAVRNAYINFEDKNTYTITVGASDDGLKKDGVAPLQCDDGTFGCPLQSVGSVLIKIIDVNEAPILYDEVRYIEEHSPKHAFVGPRISSSDPDFQDDVTTEIVGGNDDGIFKMETCNGQISLLRDVLDFERRHIYVLDVRVTDKAGLSMTGKVTVEVLDMNEKPSISGGAFSAVENLPSGTTIGTPIQSNDIDFGHKERLVYSITGGNVGDVFGVERSTGQIFVARGGPKHLNYENRPVEKDGSRAPYALQISVHDPGLMPSQPYKVHKESILSHVTNHISCAESIIVNFASMENEQSVSSLLTKPISSRDTILQRCAEVAFLGGKSYFGLSEGGACSIGDSFNVTEQSYSCVNGYGSSDSTDIYSLVITPSVINTVSL